MNLRDRLALAGGATAAAGAIMAVALGAWLPGPVRAADEMSAPAACATAKIQAMAPADTTITAAAWTDAPVPHCRIDGYVTTTNPGPNRNNFRLQLPARPLWKGRYYFIGMGGSAGYVPTDSQIPPGNPMRAGFAVAGTDTGHQGPMLDWSFLTDPAKTIDHTHRGAHLVAVATQKITRDYYGVAKIWRYHAGCSGGGRMGNEALVKHPEDYDGLLIGASGNHSAARPDAPAFGPFPAMVHEISREPGSWVSPAKLKMVDEKVTAACDATDGAVDGVVWDHRLCHYDVAQLRCKSADGPDCLTDPEIKTIKNLLRDTRMPITNMASWSFTGAVPPPWSPDTSPANMQKTAAGYVILNTWAQAYLHQPDRDVIKQPLTPQELEAMAAEQKRVGFNDPINPDLRPFEATGGKVIFWNGVSDPCCSNLNNEDYYDDVVTALGGDRNRVDRFMMLYEAPGAAHCGGGTGANDTPDQLLGALVEWVEHGKHPAGVVTHRGDRAKLMFAAADGTVSGVLVPPAAGAPRDFLLCPYPKVSVFDRAKASTPGAVYEAANWSCRAHRD